MGDDAMARRRAAADVERVGVFHPAVLGVAGGLQAVDGDFAGGGLRAVRRFDRDGGYVFVGYSFLGLNA